MTSWIKQLRATEKFAIGFVVIVATVLFATHQLIMGGSLQARLISRALPQFSCSEMSIEPFSGSWRGGKHTANSVLYMPQECSDRLQASIKADPRFREETCNIKHPCWKLAERPETYTFDFSSRKYVVFRYERSGT